MKKEKDKGFINKQKTYTKEEQEELVRNFMQMHREADLDSKSNSKCYIATMAYGDINHPKVETLRRYRDNVLINKKLGILFINYYYKFSPFLVSKLKNYRRINFIIRRILDVLIAKINKKYLN